MSLLISFATLLLWVSGLAPHGAPWGHWEGTITAQFGTVTIALDLARAADGSPAASFSVPDRKLNGLPMLSITVDGDTITFEPAAIGARFKGNLSADGSELSGLFEASAGSIPVTLTRTGEARVVAAPTNAAVAAGFEGSWTGALHAAGEKHMRLTVRNQPDGTAAATLVSIDEGGLTLPIAVTQKDRTLTFMIPAVSSSFSGTLSANEEELTGTFVTNDGFELPLTLRKDTGK